MTERSPGTGTWARVVRIGYWLYLGVGSTVMLVVCLIAGEHLLAALSSVVLVISATRCVQFFRNPDDD